MRPPIKTATVFTFASIFFAALPHASAETIGFSRNPSCDRYMPYEDTRACGYWYQGYSVACYWYPNRADCDWRYGWHWRPSL
jgi:hypothetical protein